MKVKTNMVIETAHRESDGIGGHLVVWRPTDHVIGTFCCNELGYQFIYKSARDVLAGSRFRLGHRTFEVLQLSAANKDWWKIAVLRECHES